MESAELRQIQDFIWNIADDVLRDIYSRGKYRDVILPMTVLRRIDAVLEPIKDKVCKLSLQLDKAGVSNKHDGLCGASGQAFYNISPFTLQGLKSAETAQQHKQNFEAYLDGYSNNVREILDKFNFRNQVPKLVEADILGFLVEKFLDPSINLSPEPVRDAEGHVVLPGLDNHAMGTVFEELIRRFSPGETKILLRAVSWRDEEAPAVIARQVRADVVADPEREALYGAYYVAAVADAPAKGKRKAKTQVWLTAYEPDPELRDTEQVPLREVGGIEAFFMREVRPFAGDAWIEPDSTKIGYEISFARHFYRPKPLRTLKEIRDEILALEQRNDGLLRKIVGAGA